MMYVIRHGYMSRMATIVLCACAAFSCTPRARAASSINASASSPPLAPLVPDAPLSAGQQHWVDSTLASLSLRDRVGQMVMIWMLGDYANTSDSAYAEVI